MVAFTGYFLASKHARTSDLSTVEYMAAIQLIAALVVTPLALIPHGAELPRGEDWLWLMLVVIFTGVGAHLLVNWAHRYVDVSISSLMTLGVPVVAGPAAWIALGEALHPLQLVGGAIALGAIAAVVVHPRGATADPDEALLAAAGTP